MQKVPRTFLLGLVAAIVSLPIGVILTIILLPLWSWLEATTGVESVGHSGPAYWCDWVTSIVVFCSIAVPLSVRERRNRASRRIA
jgi:ABC-type dipeptide/oligopeptide/nickel transport system permease component